MIKNVAAQKMRQLNITRIVDGDKSNNFRIEDAQYVIQSSDKDQWAHIYIYMCVARCVMQSNGR